MYRALRLWISLGLLSVLACNGNACKSAAAVSQEAPPPSPPADRWRYARMDIRDAELPARFRASLPDLTGEEENAWTPAHPPRGYVMDALCAGDPGMGERLVAAVDQAVASGAHPSKIVRSYASLLSECNTGTCAWARDVVLDAKRSAVAREVAWFRLARCDDPETAALFEQQEAPAFAYVFYLEGRRWRGPTAPTLVPFSPKLERAVSEVMRRPWEDSPRFVNHQAAALLLGETDSPQAAEALLKLHGELTDAFRRGDLEVAMYRQSHPKARTLHRAVCSRNSSHPTCKPGDSPRDKLSSNPGWFLGRLTRLEGDVPSAERLERLTGCASAPNAPSCLQVLATLSREKAVEIAKARSQAPVSGLMRDLVRALARYPASGALEAHLDGLGLTDLPRWAAPDEKSPISAEQVLLARGRALSFDVETGRFPNAHDSLLRELAALAPGALTGLSFEEVPPSSEDEKAGTGAYRLIAWGGGKRYETKARALGDWYDLEAVISFLNALAWARGSEVRWMALGTEDQFAHVVAGPSQALSSLLDSELVRSGGSDEAQAEGRAFEEKALRGLEQEGATVAE